MNQPPQASRPRVVFSEAQNLADIRARSCYKALRLVINVYFGVMMLLALILIFATAGGYSDARSPVTDQLYGRLILISVWVAGLILVVAARQLSLLLVDIADTLISDHNRNRNR